MTTMVNVIIPQAIKNILPALGNEFITLLKDTSLISVIAGKELLYAAKAISAKTYDLCSPCWACPWCTSSWSSSSPGCWVFWRGRLRASDRR